MCKKSKMLGFVLAMIICVGSAISAIAAEIPNNNDEFVTRQEVWTELSKLSYWEVIQGECLTDDIVAKDNIDQDDAWEVIDSFTHMTREEFDQEIKNIAEDVAIQCINADNIYPTESLINFVADVNPQYAVQLIDKSSFWGNELTGSTVVPLADYAGNSTDQVKGIYSMAPIGEVYSITVRVEWTWDTDYIITTLLPTTTTQARSFLVSDEGVNSHYDSRFQGGKAYEIYRQGHYIVNFGDFNLSHYYPAMKVYAYGGNWYLGYEMDSEGEYA